MLKEIQFKGITTSTSDYECSDGEMETMMNVENRRGQVEAQVDFKVLHDVGAGYRLLYHFNTSSVNHLLFQNIEDENGGVYYLDMQNDGGGLVETAVKGVGEVVDVSSVGNTLVMVTKIGVYFVRFVDSVYLLLGTRPPDIKMQFSLSDRVAVDLGGNEVLDIETDETADAFAGSFEDVAFGTGDEGEASLKKEDVKRVLKDKLWALIGLVNRWSNYSHGFVYAPFLVRYCYSMYDGTKINVSSPVFMPVHDGYEVATLFYHYKVWNSQGKKGLYKYSNFYRPANVWLMFRYDVEAYRELYELWQDVVTSVDIFISPTIDIDDSSSDDLTFPDRYRNNHSDTETMGLEMGHPSHRMVFNHITTYANVAEYWAKYSPDYKENHGNNKNEYYLYSVVLPKRSDMEIMDDIQSAVFYKATSFTLKDYWELHNNGDGWGKLPLWLMSEKAGENLLTTKEKLEYDLEVSDLSPFEDRNGRCVGAVFAYNNRVCYSGFHNASKCIQQTDKLLPYVDLFSDAIHVDEVTVEIKDAAGNYYTDHVVFRNGSHSLLLHPRMLALSPMCYPNANAKRMELKVRAGGWEGFLLVDMQSSDTEDVSYTMVHIGTMSDGDSADSIQRLLNISLVDYLARVFSCNESRQIALKEKTPSTSNLVYQSDVNNIFSVDFDNVTSVGSGTVLALRAATTALSQGQFGQYPVYAFCTDGVWALSVAADGTFTSVSPVSRDVCINPESITQIDGSIIFVSDKGVMCISGSSVSCISAALSGVINSSVELPALQSVVELAGYDSLPTSDPFNDFIASCRIAYDYSNERLIVFNPSVDDNGQRLYSFAYVYFFGSGLWGQMFCDLHNAICSYPNSIAIASNGEVLDVSVTVNDVGVTARRGLLITRPLKLDAPDTLKVVRNVILRGVFDRGDVQTVLYGSRDMKHWYLVGSSTNHELRCLSGTPYKYFRIAVISKLEKGESLSGATIEFAPRLTDVLR